MIAPWKHRPDIATDQMQAEREAPDVIERAIVAHGEIWPPTDERQMMEAAIRVVLEDFRSHIGAGSVCQSVLRDYAASIGIELAPDQPGDDAAAAAIRARGRAGMKPGLVMCAECERYPADLPSKLCPGCEAYREHTGHF